MKACSLLPPNFPQFQKTFSLPNLHNYHISHPKLSPTASSSSSKSLDDSFWGATTKWMLKFKKKDSIANTTIYLAISYLHKLTKSGFQLNKQNFEVVGAALILLSSKMNEIYPPKIKYLRSKCACHLNNEEIEKIQAEILQYFGYNMCFTDIAYSYLAQILRQQDCRKLEDAEKLLGLAVTSTDTMQSGQQAIAWAIVYLIKPSLIREVRHDSLIRIKSVANKIYNLYIENKYVKY